MVDIAHRVHPNGIAVLWSTTTDAGAFAAAVADVAAATRHAVAFVWFSRSRHDGDELARALEAAAPALLVVGCSTSGEVTPDGLQNGGVIAVLLPAEHFDAHASLLERIDRLGMDDIARHAAAARAEADAATFAAGAGTGAPTGAADSFALALMDGMTFAEEATTAALQRGLDDIGLIGGSAGDDLCFRTTDQLYGGRAHQRAAVLVIVRSRLPFRLFTDNNFVPTDVKLVVTRADVDRRVVHEFDAEPAAEAYAAAIGLHPDRLDPTRFAAHALVLRIGGEHYCRSIRHVNGDGSLSFFCAVDNGLVLTVARSVGMVTASRSMLDGIEADMGSIDCVVGFDCVYRKLDAAARGVTGRMEALLRERRFVGFNTYGEQFRSMHVNQTFTGVAFGRPRGAERGAGPDERRAPAPESSA